MTPKTKEQLEQERDRVNKEFEEHYDRTGELCDDWRDAALDEIDYELKQLED